MTTTQKRFLPWVAGLGLAVSACNGTITSPPVDGGPTTDGGDSVGGDSASDGDLGPSVCPNTVCEADETCSSCLADCGACPRELIPGVRGFADTTGPFEGTGDPAICVVNTLAWNNADLVVDSDYGGSGLSVLTGSLRRCLTDYDQIARGQGRIVLFEVGGTINANGPYAEQRLRDLDQTPRGIDYIWVAGQTAPPPGITLYNIKLICHGDHTVWQHLRFRLDDNGLDCLEAQGHKGFQAVPYPGDPPPEHTIFDHNSVTFGIDNLTSFSHFSTVTNNIFAFALSISMHPKTHDYGAAGAACPGDCECQFGESLNGHSKGVMLTGAHRAALIGNIMAFNDDRNPLLSGGATDIYLANNVIHRTTFPIMISSRDDPQIVTAIGNVAQRVNPGGPSFATIWREPVMPGSATYFEDNMCDGVAQTSPADWSLVRLAGVTDASKITDPTLAAEVFGFSPLPSADVRAHVLTHAGTRPAALDAVDALVGDRVANQTGGFIDKPEDLPDPFPHMLDSTSRNLASEMTGAGEWPIPANPFVDTDGDGRVDLVEWLNQLDEEVGGNENPDTYEQP
ncbi:hypothetical protein ACFL6C_11650 [Myxococcota bacterium]